MDVRTIRRDIEALSVEYPITTLQGNGGGVKLLSQNSPHRILLTRERQDALTRVLPLVDADIAQIFRKMLIESGGNCPT